MVWMEAQYFSPLYRWFHSNEWQNRTTHRWFRRRRKKRNWQHFFSVSFEIDKQSEYKEYSQPKLMGRKINLIFGKHATQNGQNGQNGQTKHFGYYQSIISFDSSVGKRWNRAELKQFRSSSVPSILTMGKHWQRSCTVYVRLNANIMLDINLHREHWISSA